MDRHFVSPVVLVVTLVMFAGCASTTAPTPVPSVTVPSATPSEAPVPSPTSTATASPSSSPTLSFAATVGLPPQGSWQVDLSADDLVAAGWTADVTGPGTYTWTFTGDRARLHLGDEAGNNVFCDADMAPLDYGFRLTFDAAICGGEVDDIGWTLEEDDLNLTLIETNAPVDQQTAYLETKPWQRIAVGSVPGPFPSEPPWLGRCELGCQGPIAAGVFESAGFLPGLQVTFSNDSWFNTADYHDEIQFESENSAIRFWQTAGATNETGELLTDVPRTVDGLTEWFVSNADMVVSEPEDITIGDGIEGKTFTFDVSDANVNDDPGCPVSSCLNVLWINQDHVFGIGIGSGQRLYLFNVGTGTDARTIAVSLDTHHQMLDSETTKIDEILATLHVPEP